MKRNTPPNIRSFLWKMLHGGFKVGKYWNNIPGYEDRGQCPNCEQTEDMNHILFVCPLNKGRTLWCTAREIFEQKGITWPQDMDHTYIMAAPLLKIRNHTSKTRIGASRLSTIVILECTWQTWKVRYKRVIDSEQDGLISVLDTKALNHLRSALNDRFRKDISLTNTRKYGKKAYPKQLIQIGRASCRERVSPYV